MAQAKACSQNRETRALRLVAKGLPYIAGCSILRGFLIANNNYYLDHTEIFVKE